MGSFLDCSKDLWKNKKSPSRQAHKEEKILAKDQNQGLKMVQALFDVNIIYGSDGKTVNYSIGTLPFVVSELHTLKDHQAYRLERVVVHCFSQTPENLFPILRQLYKKVPIRYSFGN